MAALNRIDVHTHYLGGSVGELLAGTVFRGGYKISVKWTTDEALAFMDRHQIATQMLSLPFAFRDLPGGRVATLKFYRQVNEEYAELARDHPGRFGAFAALPFVDTDAALAEIDYALDTLGLDGVLLPSNVDGSYFGQPFYEPVLAELGRRGVPALVHPIDSPCADVLGLGRSSSVVEFPFDTARTITNAIYTGVFQRHPGLTLILAHCGGVLPMLGWRIAEHTVMGRGPADADINPEHVRQTLKNLYYETALAGSRNSLLPTLEVTTVDHILFGTDWPPAPEPSGAQNTENIAGFGFTPNDLAGVYRDNAVRLFPRLTLP